MNHVSAKSEVLQSRPIIQSNLIFRSLAPLFINLIGGGLSQDGSIVPH